MCYIFMRNSLKIALSDGNLHGKETENGSSGKIRKIV